MSMGRAVQVFAGAMILVSVLLTEFVSQHFLWFTVFIGFNLIQSAFTGLCPATRVFKALGMKSGGVS